MCDGGVGAQLFGMVPGDLRPGGGEDFSKILDFSKCAQSDINWWESIGIGCKWVCECVFGEISRVLS